MTVAVGGRYGIFIKTEKADFNHLFQVLVGQPARAAART
jgi:roadblock/LC7 domain-containing protein